MKELIGVLVVLGGVLTGVFYLIETGRLGHRLWRVSSRGRRRYVTRQLRALRTGHAIGTFRRRLGEPDVEEHRDQSIVFGFNLPDARITALTDEHGTVGQYAVTATSPRYKPKIELTPAGGHPHLVVVLGKSTFLAVEESLQEPPTRLSGGLGASFGSYEEIYWFGRPGAFNYFGLGCDSQLPCPCSEELFGAIGRHRWLDEADPAAVLADPIVQKARAVAMIFSYRVSKADWSTRFTGY
jgi:hypothetical protein